MIDFEDPDNDDWLAGNQFTVAEGQHTRRPDIVLFVNGLPQEGGRRTINQHEADVVRRIYTEYMQGRSPLKIVQALNRGRHACHFQVTDQ